jgi:hypothetical protein
MEAPMIIAAMLLSTSLSVVVVAVDPQARTITVRAGGAARDVTLPVEAPALQRAGVLSPGQQVVLTLRAGAPGQPEVVTRIERPARRAGARSVPRAPRPSGPAAAAPPARPTPGPSPAAASPSAPPSRLPTDTVGPLRDPRVDPNVDPRQNPLRDPRVVPGLTEPVPTPTPTATPTPPPR